MNYEKKQKGVLLVKHHVSTTCAPSYITRTNHTCKHIANSTSNNAQWTL